MPATRLTQFAAAWFMLVAAAHSEAVSTADPLFQSDEIIDVRIEAPLTSILANRSLDDELPGTFQFTNSAGEPTQLDIKLRSRGRFRRTKNICKFPPLRLNFQKSQAKGTLFDKQDKVKLVTHCQNTTRYQQALLREYMAYRILNKLTDVSFRVRLLRIVYVDSEKDKESPVRYGFIIEHRDRMAKRLQASVIDIPATRIGALDPDVTNLISMYHYLIGNTDFSPIKAAEGERCCHNHVLIGKEGNLIWSVPYDFDQSGLVNAPYGVTNPKFKLRDARQRLYRGRCVNNSKLRETIAFFHEKRGEIERLVHAESALKPATAKTMSSFIAKFYKFLESEKRIDDKLIKACI